MRALSACLAFACCAACTLPVNLDANPTRRRSIVERAPLDILLVVDTSGSMREEIERLVQAIYDPACPISDLQNVPAQYRGARGATLAELAEQCGVAQLLAAVGGDFHLAVLTTDVGACDERLSAAQDPGDLHDPKPQRGCLQGPGVITRSDDVAALLEATLRDTIGYGSPYERAFDAVELFFASDTARGDESCDAHPAAFLRPEGQLLVVFAMDEDDCSHRSGAYGFFDELEDEPEQCGDFQGLFTNGNALSCGEHLDQLTPIDEARDVLRGLVDSGRTEDVFVGVLGGAVPLGDAYVPGACIATDDGVSGACFPSFGNSGSPSCDEQNCCTADATHRTAALAAAVDSEALLGSLCAPDLRRSLLPLFFRGSLDDRPGDNEPPPL